MYNNYVTGVRSNGSGFFSKYMLGQIIHGFLFSRDEATLYERVSVRPSVGWSVRPSVTLPLFDLLGATNAVYSTLFSPSTA